MELDGGEIAVADAYVAATGVKPNVDYLEGSGIDIDWGILVDNRLRTNLPNIWAAGDVAETFDRATGKRFVHAIWESEFALGAVSKYVSNEIGGRAFSHILVGTRKWVAIRPTVASCPRLCQSAVGLSALDRSLADRCYRAQPERTSPRYAQTGRR